MPHVRSGSDEMTIESESEAVESSDSPGAENLQKLPWHNFLDCSEATLGQNFHWRWGEEGGGEGEKESLV